jgi:hypothetical protein
MPPEPVDPPEADPPLPEDPLLPPMPLLPPLPVLLLELLQAADNATTPTTNMRARDIPTSWELDPGCRVGRVR